MILLITITYLLYYVFVLAIVIGWRKIKSVKISKQVNLPVITVVIPVRNEEKHIGRLIKNFKSQNYPSNLFELVFINDHSTDGTLSVLEAHLGKSDIDINVFNMVGELEGWGKRSALSLGLKKSKGEIICFTDGDTEHGPDFLAGYATAFQEPQVQFVSAPVYLNTNNSFFNDIQVLEFSSLVIVGAAAINWNFPVLCNGANIGFRKEAFLKTGAFKGETRTVSGDDLVVMGKIRTMYPNGIRFLKNPEAIVHTEPLSNWRDFINQRFRWAGKWNAMGSTPLKLLALYVFFTHVVFIISIFSLMFNWVTPSLILLLIGVKFLAEFLLFREAYKFAGKRLRLNAFIIASVLYPFYAVIFGVLSNFISYNWKGVKHKK